MKLSIKIAGVIILFSFFGCKTSRINSSTKDDGKIDITFVQVNDVYEIAPLQGGKIGGMARVATLKKENLRNNPNTYLVMAGDFVSPSVYNSLKYEGKRIRGRQMIESMNAAGMDLAVFGNHEFDITESELQDRINESTFDWVSSNTFHKTKNGISPFVKTVSGKSISFPETYIMHVKDADGTSARIGFIGITLPFNKAEYVSYTDPLLTAERLYNQVKDSCDAVIALTHQSLADDSILAVKLPGLAMIMGGHEHDMHFIKVGNVNITKAHANAKSAFVINMTLNKNKHTVVVKPELKILDETVTLDPSTDEVVKKWTTIAFKSYASTGFDAQKVVRERGEPLDGRETEIRSKPTNLTRIIVSAIEKSSPGADIAIFNSGSIRVDDIIQMPVTQYDIIRTMPYGGTIMQVDMKGKLLSKILETGRLNIGSGGFLQYSASTQYDKATKAWKIKNSPIDADKTYRVAITDFLLTGGEANMGFLTKDNPDIVKIYPSDGIDMRIPVINYMENLGK
ncbi:MAG: bifunctional metallophosphatase/5'-nucleotidase [Ginsengibacter sp.]